MDVYDDFIHNRPNLETTKISFSRWIYKQMWYTQTMDYYPVLKRNELSNHEKTWRKLKCVLLNQRSQCDKATVLCMIPLCDILGNAKLWT